MTEQLTNNPFASIMAEKHSDHLLNVIREQHRYEFEAVIAAFDELERRQLLTAELSQEKEAFIADYNEKIRQRESAESSPMENAPGGLDLLKMRAGYFFTPIILYANVLVFIVMVLNGVNAFEPSIDHLIMWGGNLRALTLNGELWRLFTNIFMHGGIFHLLLNMYALVQLGYILEPAIGKNRFVVGYLAAGILASISSIAWNENIVSVGASGAIFGLDGMLLALLLAKQLNIPEEQQKAFLSSTLMFVGYNLFYGFVQDGIDNAAHIGGLISGIAIGFVYSRVPSSKSNAIMFSVMAIIVIAVASLSPSFISNSLGEYDNAMETFAVNQEKAMWMYDEKTWAQEIKNTASFNTRLQTEGIDLWIENLSLLNALEDMPDNLQARIDLLKKYCELRRELCEAMQRTADAPEGDVAKINQLSEQVGNIVTELDASNK